MDKRETVAKALYESYRTPGDSPAWEGLYSDELRDPWLQWADVAIAALEVPTSKTETVKLYVHRDSDGGLINLSLIRPRQFWLGEGHTVKSFNTEVPL